MRLKHIKLAGFKSFVDPTRVPFEQQMTAIVGPNGCGKSNIIDAVRWVLGESSAKNLRGDAMTDVIFNGAASRKAIGQASVELVFDNTQGRLQGSMADRSQVSIRRVVNRESVNTYYLNGSKCRRRDITEIFLGTGLGPRSYAIIEQGTISRLIESKPQELRVFIEEAAGISKYKERRRETENRIKHTRENLARLNDIRQELTGQIDKLHQQAQAAKRFRTLKQQERKYKAELAVLRWQKFEQQHQQHHQQTISLENKILAQTTQVTSNELSIVTLKENIVSHNDDNHALQQQKLTITQNIARAEQNVKHLKEQASKTEQDKALTQQQLINAQQLVLAEQEQLQLCLAEFALQQPKLNDIETKLIHCQTEIAGLQSQQNDVQQQSQQQQKSINLYHQDKLKISADITQQKTIIRQLEQQLNTISVQRSQLDLAKPSVQAEKERDKLTQNLNTCQQTLESLQALEKQKLITLQNLKQQQAVLNVKQEEKAFSITTLQTKLDNVMPWHSAQHTWLSNEDINILRAVKNEITVVSGWESVADIVLAYWLQADVIEHLPQANSQGELAVEVLSLIYKQESYEQQVALETTLASKINGAPELNLWLNSILVAENYAHALTLLSTLENQQSIICPDGTWLTKYSLRKGRIEQSSDHMQERQHLTRLTGELDRINAQVQDLVEQHTHLEKEIVSLESQQGDAQQKLAAKRLLLNEHEQQQLVLSQQIKYQEQQQAILVAQQDKAINEKEMAVQALTASQKQLGSLPKYEQNDQDNLLNQQANLTQKIDRKQSHSQALYQQRHELALIVEQLKSKKLQHQQTIFNNQESINVLTKRQSDNSQSVLENSTPLREFEENLPLWLDELSQINASLLANQKRLNDSQTRLAELELAQKSSQHKINQFKEQLARLNLDSESFKLRAESALDVLVELQQDAKQVLANMPSNAKESIWQAQLIKLAKDIQLLGAINLAAIDEYETQFERKNYLDQQDQDLTKAISTLESAIAKIDRETRQKFKYTFDQVNNDLQRLFPKVFGGGQAYLALTEDDLLETGVTIMARPPGKKNSTIHLLSGGEKALTALSLVFAIFRLNPAPFCLLDEVDAPLDDANVSRFCKLVQEMSQTVQFIYISHNKIAMEMASHLTGVTMFEPGVSRMVAVDIDEAVAMAEV